jgi:seryl-tRNA synthetase
MLDIKFIRENKDVIARAIEQKNITSLDLEAFLLLDKQKLELLKEIEILRAQQNEKSDKIPQLSGLEREAMLCELKLTKEELQKKEEVFKPLEESWNYQMLLFPNIPHLEAPIGNDETFSTTIKTWGEKPVFNFDAKDHIEIMNKLGLVDFERGTKVHGFRGNFLIGDGARLCFAIWNYAMDFYSKRGFTPVIAPINVRREALLGCGFIPQGEDDIYKAQDNSYFAGTSEVSLMGMYMNETLLSLENPVKMLGFSPCFRLEAGSHAKDVKGLIRVHEFYKLEQVVLCEANHELSQSLHFEIQKNIEEFIESLGIPYRVIDAATGDMGLAKVRMYDTELWVPKEETYREIASASYFHDFQTRRLNLKYKDAQGNAKFAHSLNCTAIPTPRILVSLIENFQDKDGNIILPKVLQTYMGKEKITF